MISVGDTIYEYVSFVTDSNPDGSITLSDLEGGTVIYKDGVAIAVGTSGVEWATWSAVGNLYQLAIDTTDQGAGAYMIKISSGGPSLPSDLSYPLASAATIYVRAKIADQVLDAVSAEHTTEGTIGEKIANSSARVNITSPDVNITSS